MTVKELRDFLNDLIESGQKDKEISIKYYDDEYGVMRYESLERINTERTPYEEKEVLVLEGSGWNQ